MTMASKKFDVYLEVGKKRTFAGALDWPGWARSGRDEASALQALCDYGPRYALILQGRQLDFQEPLDVSAFTVIERLEGDTTTDFGTPGKAPSSDGRLVDAAEVQRFLTLLRACWEAFEASVHAGIGKELRKGPRGGGRGAEGILQHVLEAEASYLGSLGWKLKLGDDIGARERVNLTWQAIQEALAASAQGNLPAQGPRGGMRWTARYYVRRSAWHVLDHAWEIEDRIIE
jgi:hypothetical protein